MKNTIKFQVATMVKARLNYEDSCKYLQGQGDLEEDEIPLLPKLMPNIDDEEDTIGVSFFRTLIREAVYDNLTLPKTFFGRSQIESCSFKNTDLSSSRLCWNNFVNIDFTDANLADCDLRAAEFDGVKFINTDLRNADLRLSSFVACDFTGALMKGAKLTQDSEILPSLSQSQRKEIDFHPESEEPPGG